MLIMVFYIAMITLEGRYYMKKDLVCSKKDGFYFYSIFKYKGAALNHDAIIIDETSTDKFVEYINERKINKVIIDLFKCEFSNLDFLININFIEYLVIWGDGVMDFTPLYCLNSLKFLELVRPSQIYLDKFLKLEFFSTNDVSKVYNIDKTTSLKTLMLNDSIHKTKIYDLLFLKNLCKLDSLYLYGINLTSLNGIEKLTNIKLIVLDDLKKLEDISQIEHLQNSLTSLRVSNCTKLSNIKIISTLKHLRFLAIDNMTNIEDLDFINHLKELNTFISYKTNIINGDLTPCNNVKTVVFNPIRMHYHTMSNGVIKQYMQKDVFSEYYDFGDDKIEKWRRVKY